MFKRKEELDYANVDTIIGKDMGFNGTLSGKGILRVDGNVTGEVIQNGDIVIGESGNIEANIKARHITISGVVRGNIEATGLLQLLPMAKVYGDIKVQNLSIGDGAIFKGACDMAGKQETQKETKKDK